MTFATRVRAAAARVSAAPVSQAATPSPASGLKATIRLNIAKVEVPPNAPVSPFGNSVR